MIKNWKKFLIIYLVIGFLWAAITKFPFGVDLRSYEGNHPYWNDITYISRSYLTDSGELVLCLKGRLNNSLSSKASISEFSINIPINKIWLSKTFNANGIQVEDSESDWLSISELAIMPKCISGSVFSDISITKLDLTAKQANSFEGSSLINSEVIKNDQYYIFFMSKTYEYDGFHFKEPIEIFLMGLEPDVVGRKYYKIHFEDTWIDRNIGVEEYVLAFVKDALFYPVAIFMMGHW